MPAGCTPVGVGISGLEGRGPLTRFLGSCVSIARYSFAQLTGSMEVPVIQSSDGNAECPWSPREAELLAVTLELLQEHGYDRLTLDAVATTALASKATLYRRWPTKAELVLAAFVEGTRQVGRASCRERV